MTETADYTFLKKGPISIRDIATGTIKIPELGSLESLFSANRQAPTYTEQCMLGGGMMKDNEKRISSSDGFVHHDLCYRATAIASNGVVYTRSEDDVYCLVITSPDNNPIARNIEDWTKAQHIKDGKVMAVPCETLQSITEGIKEKKHKCSIIKLNDMQKGTYVDTVPGDTSIASPSGPASWVGFRRVYALVEDMKNAEEFKEKYGEQTFNLFNAMYNPLMGANSDALPSFAQVKEDDKALIVSVNLFSPQGIENLAENIEKSCDFPADHAYRSDDFDVGIQEAKNIMDYADSMSDFLHRTDKTGGVAMFASANIVSRNGIGAHLTTELIKDSMGGKVLREVGNVCLVLPTMPEPWPGNEIEVYSWDN